MVGYVVKIVASVYLTHDVKQISVEKPKGYTFISGKTTMLAINKPGWEDKFRPFTFTSLNKWDRLEFIIKCYREHNGVTKELEKLREGDELIMQNPWGYLAFQGKGVFIAGGTGVTPFVSIFRQLQEDKKLAGNSLIFSNKTSEDVILKEELERLLGDDFHSIFTRENVIGFRDRRIDEHLLKELVKDFNQHFYICGSESFVRDIQAILLGLGVAAHSLVIEK